MRHFIQTKEADNFEKQFLLVHNLNKTLRNFVF